MQATRHARAVRALALALAVALLAAALPALASAAPARALPRRGARGALRAASVGVLGVYQDKDLPPGGFVRDKVSRSTNTTDSWAFVAHAGQKISFRLTGAAGTKMRLALFSDSSFDPLLVTNGSGYPQKFDAYEADHLDWYYLEVGAVSGAGDYTLSYSISDPPTVTNDVDRIAGGDRFKTSVAFSKLSYPGTASTVVIATGMDYADALAGSALCGSYDAPLLLSRQATIAPEVLAEVARLAPTRVFILGGPKSVGSQIATALAAPGRTVTRIQGATRYETATKIAVEVKNHEGAAFGKRVFLVDGAKYADALSVAPVAFAKKWPVLLTETGAKPITPVTKSVFSQLGLSQTYIIGNGVRTAAYSTLASTYKTRIAGADRLLTSLAFADFATAKGWATWSTVGISSGYGFADALAGGPWVGKSGGLTLLSDWLYLHDEAYFKLYDRRGVVSRIRLFGGPNSLFGAVLAEADDALLP